jgi:peptidoglycan/xylan/chitin deacetylase (PgdA/CDA1 family)
MTWRQVADLHRAGFEIGAHTRTHVDLGQITGEHALEEIVGSRRDLENKLAVKATSFAYPYGRPNQLTEANRALVKQAGFESCCSCYGGTNDGMTDVYALLRIPIGAWHTSPFEFAYEVLTGKTQWTY